MQGNGGTIHFIGLLSDGNVHSHITQLHALLDRCVREGFRQRAGACLARRPRCRSEKRPDYIEPLEEKLAAISALPVSIIASPPAAAAWSPPWIATTPTGGGGKRLEGPCVGDGAAFASAAEAVQTYYAEDPTMTDQYMDSLRRRRQGGPVGPITDGDG
jgi:2,3-bisphosphoglycerate-independent phosphoglycerate mutase